ncbi:hypothetical protein [Saccharothrix ecbatanensis]
MESRWVHGRPGYRCRHHRGPRTEQTPPTLYHREKQLITRIGHALHLHAAASPHTVVDKLRADHAVITCHPDRVAIWNQRHLLHALREYEKSHKHPPTPPRHRQRPTTTHAATTHHRSSSGHPPRHPPPATVGRHPQRVPPRRLTCTDGIFGKHRSQAPA